MLYFRCITFEYPKHTFLHRKLDLSIKGWTMQKKIVGLVVVTTGFLTGCAGLDFGREGLAYWNSKPYLFVSVDAECKSSATVMAVPADQKFVKFDRGLGSADMSLTFSNGMLVSVGQNTDSKIPETIAAMTNLGTALAGGAKTASTDKEAAACKPTGTLFPINNGVPDLNSPLDFPIKLLANGGRVTQ